MPVYAPANTVWECTLQFAQAGHRNVVVLHYTQGVAVIDQADINAVINGFTTSVFSPAPGAESVARYMIETMTADSTYVGASLQALLQPNAGVPFPIPVAFTTGTRLGESLPPQSALLFRKSSTGPGRRGSGRVFVPGLAEADQNNGFWSFSGPLGPLTTNLQTKFQAGFLVSLTVPPGNITMSPCVYSRINKVGYQTTGFLRQPTVRNQRRRQAKLL